MAQKDNKTVVSEEDQVTFTGNEENEYTVVMKFIPLKDKNTVICFNDLSVEKNLFDKYREQLDELKSTHAQVVQADKLATLGELTAGISHEINNPLTIASGNSEIIQMILEGDNTQDNKEQLVTAINDVKESLERIHVIVNNMRSFLHKSEDQKEYVKLDDIVDKAIELVQPSFNKAKVEIAKVDKDDNIVVHVNAVKIEQVIINIAKNAMDAIVSKSIKDGKVEIILEQDSKENFVNIKIIDNGQGIPKKIQEEIFSPFFTTKEVGEGTGLGLSISSKIIESHQGQLQLESTEGKGTTFIIRLPVIEVSSYSHNEYLMNRNNNKNGKRILVVDNEVQILNIMNKFLEDEGHIFVGSTNAEEALRFLENISIDLIITDYQMPKMNGSEFSKKVREKGIDCPLFYLTSKKNIEKFNEDKDKYKVSGLILKPFSHDDILKTINAALGVKSEPSN
jgi:signal transduction histidine kinase/ActR/RegA family two-component response regulator